ncbi:MAG: symmetrical bis(5'-nucleosyl)-tetraphosphatase [Bdellovibrionaceae bacterium]|nr:symmetrical bis(5'-nucleosyl)-tetraphosphatase [Bdellovibrionales bacterium]MCB9253517.1 symmetrical bis(5'-nucleosyl)-tetraphosphatase [Pseudobdellovibrionaceae bacterium]
MATYVVGDVQGCYRSLRALVEKIAPGKNDCLVFAGDVVNRGPNSLEVLRFLSEGSLSVRCVLGNHDLWALARYYLKVPPGKRDTLDPLLESPDASRLFEWLGQWPLAEAIGNGLSLHGGVHPDWTQELSLQLSSAVQKRLNGSERDGFLQRIIARNAPEWNPTLDEYERELAAVRWFTRARVCDPNGRLDAEFSGPPDAIPAGLLPWYAVPGRRTKGRRLYFGHWAAHGFLCNSDVVALDTGCVWGGQLTAIRAEDDHLFQVPSAEV